ncbi:hypothetical protein PGTUg99_031272 [Puccinia graminis f. sp. tritici]|uniref:Secreted protein n=1 Tax=Puccinia graminis f. sp. tritici TaxID=56615 RepID=A0A5B0R9P9_PUCGR|nr:hypothetical protein PGTUg99_031272 [Puccinia graminis f. sp. tritici]
MDELFRALFSCICLCAAGSSACKSGDEVAAAGVCRPGSKSLGEDALLPFSASVPMDGHFQTSRLSTPWASETYADFSLPHIVILSIASGPY